MGMVIHVIFTFSVVQCFAFSTHTVLLLQQLMFFEGRKFYPKPILEGAQEGPLFSSLKDRVQHCGGWNPYPVSRRRSA